MKKRLKTSTAETPLLASVTHVSHGVVPSTSDLEPLTMSSVQLEVRLATLSNLKDIASIKVYASPSLINPEDILDHLLDENASAFYRTRKTMSFYSNNFYPLWVKN